MTQTEVDYDYKKLGLRIGIEIHQQLKTKGKLFCRCINELQTKKPDFHLIRTFRPVLGEEGKFDQAMLLEFKKKTFVEYEGYYNNICTYEFDETPPFECDEECLNIGIEIALLLKLNMVDELHICRKNYVDGSVPAGFQRTMVLGLDGKIPLNEKKDMGIEFLMLEEDAGRKIAQEGRKTIFRLDRLGIPLIELVTAPDMNTPEEARMGAYRLGLLLRSTGKVRRVLGATRQDINISIKEGNRIEIKGVQKLDQIPILVKNEVRRQIALVDIKKKMKERGINVEILQQKPVDTTKILKNTKCKFVNKGIKNKQKVLGLLVPKMEGLWGIEVQEGRRFGTEVANKVKIITGLKGLIHSDEDLKKYNFSDEEISTIKEKLNYNKGDLFVLIMGSESKLKDAMDIVIKRVISALDGVPQETRKPLEDGNHEFLRDIHGGSRLYPDTDTREIIIDKERVATIQKTLPKYPWDMIPDLAKKYKLKPELIEDLIMGGYIFLFEKIMASFKGKAMLVATTIVDQVKSLRRDGNNVDNITDEHFIELFNLTDEGKFTKEAFEDVLIYVCKHPKVTIAETVKKMDITSMSQEDLDEIVYKVIPKFEKLIEERGLGAMGPIMGAVMKEARGKIDGKLVNQAVKKEIEKRMKGGKK
ncbi:MAG: Glu-tRNA(Gln) amidotransferase subunit GatE [archaeon]|nr:Glu-tRNA(Gln) amidotransferase subunit GatE [archaeon]